MMKLSANVATAEPQQQSEQSEQHQHQHHHHHQQSSITVWHHQSKMVSQSESPLQSESPPKHHHTPISRGFQNMAPTSAHKQQRSTNSNSSSLDEMEQQHQQQPEQQQEPNELIIDHNQTIAIEVPANVLKIDLPPFRPATEIHPEPGDIIEIDRTLFSQWGIYVGDGDVVMIVGGHQLPDTETAIVQRLPLIQVAGDNYCRVNNKCLRARERNLLPFNNAIVVCKALSKVGSMVPYNVLQCNTEHYVTEWKYGQRWSDQAQVSLHSFNAVKLQHTNSISESHNLLVNTLNQVLNSPAVVAHQQQQQSCSPPFATSTTTGSSPNSSPPLQINQQQSMQNSHNNHPMNIQQRPNRSVSIGSSGASNSPPNSLTSMSTSQSFGTSPGCQTELSFF